MAIDSENFPGWRTPWVHTNDVEKTYASHGDKIEKKVEPKSAGFRVQGSGFRVQGSGFRVQGSGFRVQGSGFRVQGSGFRVWDFWDSGFWVCEAS
jgi:hypothetical protein